MGMDLGPVPGAPMEPRERAELMAKRAKPEVTLGEALLSMRGFSAGAIPIMVFIMAVELKQAWEIGGQNPHWTLAMWIVLGLALVLFRQRDRLIISRQREQIEELGEQLANEIQVNIERERWAEVEVAQADAEKVARPRYAMPSGRR